MHLPIDIYNTFKLHSDNFEILSNEIDESVQAYVQRACPILICLDQRTRIPDLPSASVLLKDLFLEKLINRS